MLPSIRCCLVAVALAPALLAAQAGEIDPARRDPRPDTLHPPSMAGIGIASGGVRMHGIIYRAAGAGDHPVVVFLHGFPGNEKNLDIAQAVRRAGYHAVYFDYRGSWGNGGTFSFAGGLEDAGAALAWVRSPANAVRHRIENGAVPRVSRGGAEQSLVRIGLCSPEVRARNLACGHTMARYVLLDAVGALHAAGRMPGGAHDELREALESVCNSIHLLDHQKGDAERQVALASEMDREERASAARSAEEVKRLEERHDVFAEQIRELRGAVLAHLDAAILADCARLRRSDGCPGRGSRITCSRRTDRPLS